MKGLTSAPRGEASWQPNGLEMSRPASPMNGADPAGRVGRVVRRRNGGKNAEVEGIVVRADTAVRDGLCSDNSLC
jgi:hypothetical protein